jgi:hypothetical protein
MIDINQLNGSNIINNLFNCLLKCEEHPHINCKGLLDVLKMIYKKHKGKIVFNSLDHLVNLLISFVFPSNDKTNKGIMQHILSLLQEIFTSNKQYISNITKSFMLPLLQYQKPLAWKISLCDPKETSDNKYVGLANPGSRNTTINH